MHYTIKDLRRCGDFFYTQKLLKYLLSSLVEQNSNISKKKKLKELILCFSSIIIQALS
nr:MAG TPA: hypothetical protein [Caudoviricetes sp.]